MRLEYLILCMTEIIASKFIRKTQNCKCHCRWGWVLFDQMRENRFDCGYTEKHFLKGKMISFQQNLRLSLNPLSFHNSNQEAQDFDLRDHARKWLLAVVLLSQRISTQRDRPATPMLCHSVEFLAHLHEFQMLMNNTFTFFECISTHTTDFYLPASLCRYSIAVCSIAQDVFHVFGYILNSCHHMSTHLKWQIYFVKNKSVFRWCAKRTSCRIKWPPM